MNLIMGQCHKYIFNLELCQRYIYARLAGIKPMTQEISHFSENSIYLSLPVTLKLGKGHRHQISYYACHDILMCN